MLVASSTTQELIYNRAAATIITTPALPAKMLFKLDALLGLTIGDGVAGVDVGTMGKPVEDAVPTMVNAEVVPMETGGM